MAQEIIRNDTVDKSGIDLLKKLKGCRLENIFVDFCFCKSEEAIPDYEWVSHIFFKTYDNDQLFYLRSVLEDESGDKDEYFKFDISECEKEKMNMKYYLMKTDANKNPVLDKIEDYKWHEIKVDGKIESIHIYRDNATWSYNGTDWDITTDVAIKIVGDNFKCLFVLQDTLFSFVSVHFNYVEEDNDLINKFWKKTKWGFKCEGVASLNRQRFEI